MAKSDQKYDIVGLGSCGIDLRVAVPKLPSADYKVTGENLEISEGGVTANNLVQAGRLGLKVCWVGALGNDEWKDHSVEKLKEADVGAYPVVIDGEHTQQFWIPTAPDGQAALIGIPASSSKLTVEQVRENFSDLIKNAKHLHLELATVNLKAILEGAKVAKENNVKVLLDIDGDPWYLTEHEKLGTKEELMELLALSDVVKFSKSGVLGIIEGKEFSAHLVKDILSFGPKVAVATLGEEGCVLATKDELVEVPAFDIEVKDTVGAGDAFMGGLSYALLQGWDLEKVGKFASACGAFKCTQYTARGSGTLAQVQDFLKKYDK